MTSSKNTGLNERLLSDADCFADIKGQAEAKEQLKSALLMGRHVLIMGPPGIGKTTIAKNVARLLPDKRLNTCAYHCDPERPLCPDCMAGRSESAIIPGEQRFVRVQGSPDLSSEDLLGDIDPIKALEFGPLSREAFTPGKLFRATEGVLFFDELNRAPERLQNALLQALEERTVTLGTYDIDFPTSFIFIGTMNPADASTERISDVLLDRFDIVYMGYPETLEIEREIINERGQKHVHFPPALLDDAIAFVRSLRGHSQLERYPSVRASIGIFERAQSLALIRKHPEVTHDDVKDALISVLSHRISLKSSIKYLKDPREVITEAYEKRATPRESEPEGGDDP